MAIIAEYKIDVTGKAGRMRLDGKRVPARDGLASYKAILKLLRAQFGEAAIECAGEGIFSIIRVHK